jgi:hypothetical protein
MELAQAFLIQLDNSFNIFQQNISCSKLNEAVYGRMFALYFISLNSYHDVSVGSKFICRPVFFPLFQFEINSLSTSHLTVLSGVT